MLNLTRLHLGIAHESQFQGLGIRGGDGGDVVHGETSAGRQEEGRREITRSPGQCGRGGWLGLRSSRWLSALGRGLFRAADSCFAAASSFASCVRKPTLIALPPNNASSGSRIRKF